MMDIRTVNATRYILPLREGGSLPALIDADDGFKYVLKFRASGHGTKSLVAEFLGSLIAKALGHKVPEVVFIELDEAFGRSEGDEEIQDLLKNSRGLNMGLHFLSGAITFDPVVCEVDPITASKIVWLDAYTMNVDRTARNTNMLMWNRELWLIDHGSTFFFHHSWTGWERFIKKPFEYLKSHVLLRSATQLREVDAECRAALTDEVIDTIVDTLPADWLNWGEDGETAEDLRNVYRRFLKERRDNSDQFIGESPSALTKK